MDRVKEACAFVSLAELLELKSHAMHFSLKRIKPISSNGSKRFCRLLSRGMEFEESRRYLPGDDVRSMDWKVTARTGRSHTKLFAEEKENQVIVAVDMRLPMFFATEGSFKSVQAALMAACFSWNALSHKNPIGGLVFTEEKLLEFKSTSLKKGLHPFLQALAKESQNFLKEPFGKTCLNLVSFEKIVESLKRMKASQSLIFLISDFRNMQEKDLQALVQVAKHSQLFLLFLYDAFEVDLPKNGRFSATDGKKEIELDLSDKKERENYRKQFLARKEAVSSLSAYKNIHFIECSTKDDCLDLIKNYFN